MTDDEQGGSPQPDMLDTSVDSDPHSPSYPDPETAYNPTWNPHDQEQLSNIYYHRRMNRSIEDLQAEGQESTVSNADNSHAKIVDRSSKVSNATSVQGGTIHTEEGVIQSIETAGEDVRGDQDVPSTTTTASEKSDPVRMARENRLLTEYVKLYAIITEKDREYMSLCSKTKTTPRAKPGNKRGDTFSTTPSIGTMYARIRVLKSEITTLDQAIEDLKSQSK